VLKVEAEGTTSLAFARGEADKAARKVALLEGELADARQYRDMIEANVQGLSNRVADVVAISNSNSKSLNFSI
jgi:hypothetical protein